MIIGIDISQAVYQTGVSRYTQELVRHLLRIDTANTYKLFAGVYRQQQVLSDYLSSLSSEGLHFQEYRIPLPPKVADLVWNRLHWFPVEQFIGKTDIIHTSNWAQPPARAKKITTVHDLTPLLYPQFHTDYVVHNFKQNLSWVQRECQKVIVDSQATKEDLIRLTSLHEDQISVVYLAAKEDFKPVSNPKQITDITRKYNIGSQYILTVGTKEPRKNLRRLVEAYNQLDPLANPVQLVIVGKEGWGETEVSENKPSIIYTGFVPDDDLPALYSGALGFAYISEYEGFGLPVLEAMQCGCPVITSTISSLPEVAGTAGLLVNPLNTAEVKQALTAIITDDNLRHRLSTQSRERAKEFSWKKTAQQTLDIYQHSEKES